MTSQYECVSTAAGIDELVRRRHLVNQEPGEVTSGPDTAGLLNSLRRSVGRLVGRSTVGRLMMLTCVTAGL